LKNFNVLDNIQEAKEIEKLYSQFINLWEPNTSYPGYLKITDKAKLIQRDY